jgi:hypothetical protein
VDGLGNGSAALAHDAAIAADAANPVLPALAVLAAALALIDEFSELGAAVLMLDLGRGEAGYDVVAVGEE